MEIRTAGGFAGWAAFAVDDMQGFALLDTGASRTVGGYTMVQHVIDSLLTMFPLREMNRNNLGPWCGSPAAGSTL